VISDDVGWLDEANSSPKRNGQMEGREGEGNLINDFV